ncbi:phage tail tape measure protein [Streptomyces sp. PR69]|uniref:phage tail tape measure protein n=1 Tax=Streptomyces sp. PR69 TaxID=2984950 RepID=UPI0022648AB2|nr:phage tail tape measure protein [Streptomyces sp. PR69]
MALKVGELVGYIRLDDGQVRPALTRTEAALHASGRRMASDAERAGQDVGQQLGDGIVRGADGRIRDARGRFIDAGRMAGRAGGDALGDGLVQGADQGAGDAVNAAEGGLSRLQMVAAGVGVAAGAALMAGMAQHLEQEQITGRLGAQLGKTPAEAKRYGKIAGELYADAITQDFQGAADAISATMRSGLVPADATNEQIKSIATNVSDLASTFELDLGQAANAIGQTMKAGLAPDAKTALDVITCGLTVMGPRADDIADTFNEYSTIFRQLGISAADATGIMAQGMAAGARDTDVVADSLKELVLITQDGGEEVDKAFKKIHLSGKDMQKAMTEGGPASKKALDQIFDGLRKIKDPADRSALALTLFGTKSEDMQKALFAIDPSTAVDALGKTAGAADKAGTALRDNAGARVEQFKRSLEQGMVNFIGTQVIPALARFGQWAQRNSETLKLLAVVIGGALIPVLVLLAVNATVAAVRVVAAWVMSGAAALQSAGTQVAAGARVAATWVLMGVQSLVHAARMAAAWVLAMGPVAWVIAAIVALAAIIVLNWDKITRATGKAWDWVWGKIQGVGKAILGFILGMPLVRYFLQHWDRIRSGTASKVLSFISWVRGLPGRILRAIGSLRSLLYNKGRDLIVGLWNGIRGMGGWLKSKLLSFARSKIPGPIARALGIASPSKLMRDKIGRFIPAGIVDGIERGAPALDRTMAGLVQPPTVGGMGMGTAGGSRRAMGRGGRTVLELRSDGSRLGDLLLDVVRHSIRVRGGDPDIVLAGEA